MEVLKLSQGVTEVMMTRSLRTATTIVKICDCHAGQCDNPPGWQKNLQCLQHLAPAANSAAPGKKSFSPPSLLRSVSPSPAGPNTTSLLIVLSHHRCPNHPTGMTSAVTKTLFGDCTVVPVGYECFSLCTERVCLIC